MPHRWSMVLFGSSLCLVLVGPAWALPTHDYDLGWGKSGLHDKHAYGYAGGDDKYEKYGKLNSHPKKDHDLDKSWWGKLEKHHDYGGYEFKKWGKGYGKEDPDCDPPVSTPEPATLLLLGSTLAGFGVYARRRRQPA